MKLSEFIATAQEFLAANGDMHVCMWPDKYSGDMRCPPPTFNIHKLAGGPAVLIEGDYEAIRTNRNP